MREVVGARAALTCPICRAWNALQYNLAIVSRLCLNLAHTACGLTRLREKMKADPSGIRECK